MVVAITSTYTIIGYFPLVFCESRLISTLPSEKQKKTRKIVAHISFKSEDHP